MFNTHSQVIHVFSSALFVVVTLLISARYERKITRAGANVSREKYRAVLDEHAFLSYDNEKLTRRISAYCIIPRKAQR